jgi:hypothetical protein
MENEKRVHTTEGMSTLTEMITLATEKGYTEEFKITPQGLTVPGSEEVFQPQDIHIHNFYRFEGPSAPDDMAIMYLVETTSGVKGTLTDAYGTYSDTRINEFIKQVEDFQKKTDHPQH